MDCEKKSVAKIVMEINERMLREQSSGISSPIPHSRKDAVLLKKRKLGTYVEKSTNVVVSPSNVETGNGITPLFFEKIVGKGDMHGTIYNQNTPESYSNLKTPFSASGVERYSAEYSSTKCKKIHGTSSTHKNRVTFAENIVTDVFYYEGSADIDDSELSGEICDTVPQSALNTDDRGPERTHMASRKYERAIPENLQPDAAQRYRGQTEKSKSDALESNGTSGTLFQETSQKGTMDQYQSHLDIKVLSDKKESGSKDCKEYLSVLEKKSIRSKRDVNSFASIDKKHCTEESHADSKEKKIDTEVSNRFCPNKIQPHHGSPDAARVREEIEAIRKSLSIRDLIRMFEIKIRDNRP